MTINTLNSEGPWRLTPDSDLAPGDSAVFDLFNYEYNGRKAYFKPKLPLDEAQIINQDGANSLVAEFNGVHESYVIPNTVESYDDAGITRVVVTNDGGSTISAADVTLILAKDGYTADDAAREAKGQTVAERAVSKLSGGIL